MHDFRRKRLSRRHLVQSALYHGAAARRAGISVLRQGAGLRPSAADDLSAGGKNRGKRPESRPYRAGLSADRRSDAARHGARDRSCARRSAGGLARPAARGPARQIPPSGRRRRARRHPSPEKQGRCERSAPPHGVRGAFPALLWPSAAQGAPPRRQRHSVPRGPSGGIFRSSAVRSDGRTAPRRSWKLRRTAPPAVR